jgi:hypothetical protein
VKAGFCSSKHAVKQKETYGATGQSNKLNRAFIIRLRMIEFLSRPLRIFYPKIFGDSAYPHSAHLQSHIRQRTGDKLTAFAPNTIGIPYFKGKDMQPFSMEICKQLFDLSKLFERIESVEMVAKSFMAFAKKEINYRKNGNPKTEVTPGMVLQDTIDTCLIIAKRGGGTDEGMQKFAELQRGIKAFDFGFLMTGHFRIDDAVPAAARIAYLSAI